MPKRPWADAATHALGRPAGAPGPEGLACRADHGVGLSTLRPSRPAGVTHPPPPRAWPVAATTAPDRNANAGKSSWPAQGAAGLSREEWPREESNLRARIRSPSLYPLSYGAVRSSVAAPSAKSNRPSHAAEAGFARLRRNRSTKRRYRRKSCAAGATFGGEVADGTRTHDHLDHNQGLYQLSYSHRAQAQNSGASPKT